MTQPNNLSSYIEEVQTDRVGYQIEMASRQSGHIPFNYMHHPSTSNTTIQPPNSNFTYNQLVNNDESKISENTTKQFIPPKKQDAELDITSPNYYMNLFLDEYVMNLLVDGTNWYIDSVPRNRKDKITHVTHDELRCVIAVLYLSGYVNLPRVRMFWEKAPDTSFPLVVNAIPRDRFETIFTNIHSINSSSVDRKDPLSRISTLVEALRNRFIQFVPMEEVHSVDELNVPYYKQSTGLRQFTKTRTMKVWCGCTNSGYCMWFDHIEEIPGESQALRPHINKIFTYASKINSFKLSKPCLIYDSIYNDIRIVNELREMKIEAKPVPNRISLSASKSQNVHLEKLKDQAKVHNSPMGGIDRLDQNINLYPISIIGKKWTFHFLLAYILDLTMQNAWQLYREKNKNSLDLLGFRRSIVTYYLTQYGKPLIFKGIGSRKRIIKTSVRNGVIIEVPVLKSHYYRCKDIRFDGSEHYVTPQSKQTRCYHCKMKTTTRCSKCDVGIHVKCFIDYHTRTEESAGSNKREIAEKSNVL